MRRHFLVGIVAERKDESAPVEACEFIADFSMKPMIIRIKFCPFCGKSIDQRQTVWVT